VRGKPRKVQLCHTGHFVADRKYKKEKRVHLIGRKGKRNEGGEGMSRGGDVCNTTLRWGEKGLWGCTASNHTTEKND